MGFLLGCCTPLTAQNALATHSFLLLFYNCYRILSMPVFIITRPFSCLQWQPDSVCVANGDAGANPVRVCDQGTISRAGGTQWWQADRGGSRETRGGKKLLQELHHPEDGGLPSHEHTAGAIARTPAASQRPEHVQPWHHLRETHTHTHTLIRCQVQMH